MAEQTPSAFATANCLVEKDQTPLPPFSGPLRQGYLRTTDVGFILHPVTLQQKRTSSTFLPIEQKQKLRRASGEMLPSLLRLGGRATGKVHATDFSRLGTQGRDQASPLGLAWAHGSRSHPQKHSPGDSEAHKATLLGDLQTDYKFTGDNQGI